VKTDEAEQVTTTRYQIYADAYKDYQGKVIVVIVLLGGPLCGRVLSDVAVQDPS
jgi:hypothetical protein